MCLLSRKFLLLVRKECAKGYVSFLLILNCDCASDLDKGAMLEYEVYFPKNFDFVMGGKLPGLHGGNLQCSGYSSVPNGKNCFTTRLMWRENGEGEAYMYVDLKDQKDDFCKQCSYPVASKCSSFSGVENCSWNRGTFKFQKGKWHRVAQYIKMNTPGKQDGVFEVSIGLSARPLPPADLGCFRLVHFARSRHV